MTPDPATRSANRFVDSDHPAVIRFAESHRRATPRESAVALYYEVREMLRYNPWRVRFEAGDYTSSGVLLRDRSEGAHCIDKALLLAGACRALGIPSRMHYANVRNHIGTARLEEKLGTDLLVYHGWAELFLGGRWVGATPAFNSELCRRLGVAPLEFDGVHDAVFQAYDATGARFMEYIADHGAHPGVPLEQMVAAWKAHYPSVRDGVWPAPSGTT
ncbi:MAG: transglutaminase family protein [Deltaproteobacteria bacterium]|nr:transglutaminase family protein [Deltaproteobacteria bacterium]